MSFFKRLRERTGREPAPAAERELFRKLDAEFARDFGERGFRAAWARAFAPGRGLRYAPVAALGLAVAFFAGKIESPGVRPEGAPIAAADAAFEEDLEFYEELDDWMLVSIAEE